MAIKVALAPPLSHHGPTAYAIVPRATRGVGSGPKWPTGNQLGFSDNRRATPGNESGFKDIESIAIDANHWAKSG